VISTTVKVVVMEAVIEEDEEVGMFGTSAKSLRIINCSDFCNSD
jgi:hypothetical protein